VTAFRFFQAVVPRSRYWNTPLAERLKNTLWLTEYSSEVPLKGVTTSALRLAVPRASRMAWTRCWPVGQAAAHFGPRGCVDAGTRPQLGDLQLVRPAVRGHAHDGAGTGFIALGVAMQCREGASIGLPRRPNERTSSRMSLAMHWDWLTVTEGAATPRCLPHRRSRPGSCWDRTPSRTDGDHAASGVTPAGS
jgi:hypothetical protein